MEGVNREARLRLVLGLNVALVAGLVSVGFLAHSLGLLAAAWDTVTDVAVVGISLVAVRMVRRPPTAQRTFGYHRSTILAAQANAAGILAVSILILVEGVRRLFQTHHVEGGLVVVVAVAALLVNGIAALVLRADAEDLNMRAVLVDTVGDAAANAGVAVAGAVILLTDGHFWVDPVVSILIAIVGLSKDPDRPSYSVAMYLQNNGYKIIPVRPGGGEILGEKVYEKLRDVPHKIDPGERASDSSARRTGADPRRPAHSSARSSGESRRAAATASTNRTRPIASSSSSGGQHLLACTHRARPRHSVAHHTQMTRLARVSFYELPSGRISVGKKSAGRTTRSETRRSR